MGRLRTRTERLENLLPDPQGSTVGWVVTVTNYVDDRGITQWTYELAAGGGGGVTSLNALVGALTITSLDGSVVVTTPTSSTIDLSVTATGTVTSVNVSGGTSGLVWTGGPVT